MLSKKYQCTLIICETLLLILTVFYEIDLKLKDEEEFFQGMSSKNSF